MKKLAFLSLFYFTFTYINIAQFLNHTSVQVLLYGVVTDEITKKPVGATIEFKTSGGKWFKIKSDSITGKYQQVFTSGEEIEATLYYWDVIRRIVKFKLPDTSKYAEFERNFEIIHLETGKIIATLDAFPTGSSNLSDNAKNLLQELDIWLKFNRNVKFNIKVTAHDTYFNRYDIKERKEIIKVKGKKTTQIHYDTTIVYPNSELIRQLVDSRTQQVQPLISSIVRGKDKLFVISDYSPGGLIEKVGPNQPDLLIEVRELKNVLAK
ncbi:MAG: hypothetical protein ACUVQ1_04920 [Candidatus Kapaibacteriales bacterium]